MLDIETAPNTAFVWGLWDRFVPIDRLVESGYTLCWAAKWLGQKEVMFDSLYESGTTGMLKRIHKLMEEADAIVTYNGAKFDLPTLNREFIIHGLEPPAPYKSIDLLKTVRKQFRFTSNKLDYVCEVLGLGNKVKHKGMSLWVGCMDNDPASWVTMEEYNRGDVILLEDLYLKVLPWIPNHPNHGLYIDDLEEDEHICPNCGGNDAKPRGFAYTGTGKYQRYKCGDCAKWFRGRTSLVPRNEGKAIMASL